MSGAPRPAPAAMPESRLPPYDPTLDGGDGENEFHLADYLRILQARWRLIAIVTLVALAFALLQFAVTPKEYRATTLIQIDRKVSSH
ncbi:MAG: Wzz/FepE/Etk N-terminal domain-containing protein [Thermoanaerobaculia bacterium]